MAESDNAHLPVTEVLLLGMGMQALLPVPLTPWQSSWISQGNSDSSHSKDSPVN